MGQSARYDSQDLNFKITEQANILRMQNLYTDLVERSIKVKNILLDVKKTMANRWDLTDDQKVSLFTYLILISL